MVSEFMLQQTGVTTVIPYFERWMQSFPNVQALAAATEEDVLQLWQGLGYYSRARNLHQAAREVVNVYKGKIPDDITLLRRLSGVGPYTAAAIAAFAFDQSVPVLDANIIRVVARLFDYRDMIGAAKGRAFLEKAARMLLPNSGGGCAHTSALMDLGATICRSGKPKCEVCPVIIFCKARDPALIPLKPARASVLQETERRAFAQKGDKLYLVPSTGPRWKGLWILPLAKQSNKPIITLFYTLTRHRVRLEIVKSRPYKGWTIFSKNELPPMPAPHRRALNQIFSAAKLQ